LFVCVLLSACDCKGGSAAKRAQQPAPAPAATAAEESNAAKPPPHLGPAGERFRAFFPDKIAEFTAPGPGVPQIMPIPSGGTWTIMRRKYTKGEQTLTLEASDVLHTHGLTQLIESQQGKTRTSEDSTFRGAPIQGQPSMVQWFGKNKTAVVNILAKQRILITLKITPTDEAETAATIAGSLPVEQYADLAIAASVEERPEPGAPAPAAPAPTNSAPAKP
jgi:hypothetical protein